MRVMVTGANRGIGLEFVQQYAAEGWEVEACCRHPDQASELKAVQGDVRVYALDLSKEPEINAFRHKLGGRSLDVLIHNAGVYGRRDCRFGQVDFDDWKRTMWVNCMAPLALSEVLLNSMSTTKGARLVAITSKMGSIADNTSGGSYVYRSSKAALNMVMRSMAHDLAGQNVSVAVIHPGWVRTDMGGSNGLIDPGESVAGMRGVIEKLAPENTGQFFNYDGRVIPW